MESPSDSGVLPIDIDPVTGVLRARGVNPTNRRNFLAIVPAGAMALGAALLGMSSPGPNAQSFQDTYVRKNPDALQTLVAQQLPGGAGDQIPALVFTTYDTVTANGRAIVGRNPNNPTVDTMWFNPENGEVVVGSGGLSAFLPGLGNVVVMFFPQEDPVESPAGMIGVFGSGYNDKWRGPEEIGDENPSLNWRGTPQREAVLATETYASSRIGALFRNSAIGDRIATYITGLLQRNSLFIEDNSGVVPVQVGLPTGLTGTPNTYERQGHRHPFSGRFTFSGTYPAALLAGGAFPNNFARIKINNNWTLRRIWVYTNAGPTGGTETYGVVNAAGALQGTAVVLPAGPGVSQAESALQVTNLTGATLYYLAQTAATSVAGPASANVEVGVEYTMNI